MSAHFFGPAIPFDFGSTEDPIGYPFASDRHGNQVEWRGLTTGKAGILVTGSSGAGKTNAVQLFAHGAVEHEDHVFVIDLFKNGIEWEQFPGAHIATTLDGAAETLNRIHGIVRESENAELPVRVLLIVEHVDAALQLQPVPELPSGTTLHVIGVAEAERIEVRRLNNLRNELQHAIARIARLGQDTGVQLVLTSYGSLRPQRGSAFATDIMSNVNILALGRQSYGNLIEQLGAGSLPELSEDEPLGFGLFANDVEAVLPVRVHRYDRDRHLAWVNR